MSIKGAIRRWLEPRLRTRGYHLLSDWQLAKYDQTTHTSQLLAALNGDEESVWAAIAPHAPGLRERVMKRYAAADRE